MKKRFYLFASAITALLLSACGNSESAPASSGIFGTIPGQMEQYEQKSDALKATITNDNFGKVSKELDDLKTKYKENLEKESEAINGKEVPVEFDSEILKQEGPLTIAYLSMNAKAPNLGFAGNIVAAKDLTLNIGEKDLKPSPYLSGNYKVRVTMPVGIEFLDKEGNVVLNRNEIGILPAENNGTTAIVKAGTPIEFGKRSFPMSPKMADVVKVRLTVDLSKVPYYSTVKDE
ncbi:MAG: hypothetical protein K2J82_02115 [Muribaculaceae bacterium]|nr:hypothetical protein [Muribaculaceae bacterium]MDE6753387.1 hypothetical protein [Muribaculaceae bacterium]